MKPLLISSGEPAGIGPDLCVMIASQYQNVVVAGDRDVLIQRARLLNLQVEFEDYVPGNKLTTSSMKIWHMPMPSPVVPGILNDENAQAVLSMLRKTCEACLNKQFSALVTAPVHKAHLQKADAMFVGHTEFFQMVCRASNVVMMLADESFRVALVTTHLPLREVPNAITPQKLEEIIETVYKGLQKDFQIKKPHIAVAGLNPHAGENGCLGHEEQDIMIPIIHKLQKRGWNIEGPLSADTMFRRQGYDAFIAMYHDQGLSVFKYATFGNAANITLGLPMIRTSVDHGTALDLAGTGNISIGSMRVAFDMALKMVECRGEGV